MSTAFGTGWVSGNRGERPGSDPTIDNGHGPHVCFACPMSCGLLCWWCQVERLCPEAGQRVSWQDGEMGPLATSPGPDHPPESLPHTLGGGQSSLHSGYGDNKNMTRGVNLEMTWLPGPWHAFLRPPQPVLIPQRFPLAQGKPIPGSELKSPEHSDHHGTWGTQVGEAPVSPACSPNCSASEPTQGASWGVCPAFDK